MSFSNFPSFKCRDTTNRFVNDLRKELENDRKMFDDDFNFFSSGRPSNLRSRLGQHHPSFFTRNFESPPSASGFGSSSSSSQHPGASSSSSSSESSGGERVIPIRVCTGDDASSPNKSQGPTTNTATTSTSRGASPKPESQKGYSTQRNNTTEMPSVKEISRGQRAQSAPPGPDCVMTECGGGQSKKSSSNNVRHIPIFVEGQSSPSGTSSGSQQGKSKGPSGTGGGGGGGGQDPNRSSDPELKPTPAKKPTLLDPLEKIKIVAEQVKELAEKVNEFNGKDGKNKEYLYLDEMLTRLLIQLDDVVVEGRDDIRQARRECIKAIQKCIADLDVKIQAETGNPSTPCTTVALVTTTEEGGDGDNTKDNTKQDSCSLQPQTSEKLQNMENPTTNSSTNPVQGEIPTTESIKEQVKEKSLPPESDKMQTSS